MPMELLSNSKIHSKIRGLAILCLIYSGFTLVAQEGMSALQRNAALQFYTHGVENPSLDKIGMILMNVDYTYEYLIDTNHLPILDDFTKNNFKKFNVDLSNTPVDTLIWQVFLVDGVYTEFMVP